VAQMAVEEMLKLDLGLNKAIRQPVADFMNIEWIDLLPRAPGDTEQEVLENDRISNVRNPQIGIFHSTLGEGPRPAVVICPGGGYHILSIEKEGYEVARWFNSMGIDAYVLKYRMKEFGYPAPLIDVTRAVRYVRAHAGELGVNPEQIGVLGFSAGGHVAAMGTTIFDAPDAKVGDALDAVSARPDFSVLCYAVISMRDPYTHKGSRFGLLGEDPDPSLVEALSLENRVGPDTPPVFLFHTADDASVPVENSLHFADSMARNDRPFALHVYPSAPHGIGMRPGFGTASTWPMALGAWLDELGLVWKGSD